jgi:competence ComEA-like helix-hairpin-helix protein
LPETAAAEDFGDVDRLAGVNLNTATAEQLAALKGVSRAVARRIVEHRAEHGPFRDVFDLMQIPRIGRKTFKAITGMPCSRRHRHRRERMATLLALPPDRASHLPSIAQALAGQPGFAGCIISDDEGFRIASRGAEPYAEALSAVLPKLTRQVRDSMKECTPEEIRSLSIQIGRHMATIVPGQDVFLTAVHDASRLTMGQLRLVTRVARELAWLLGRRGYVTVGIPPAGAEREPADAPPVSASPSAEETTP